METPNRSEVANLAPREAWRALLAEMLEEVGASEAAGQDPRSWSDIPVPSWSERRQELAERAAVWAAEPPGWLRPPRSAAEAAFRRRMAGSLGADETPPLVWGARLGVLPLVETLLRAGVDPERRVGAEVKRGYAMTPLLAAAAAKRAECVELLASAGAQAGARDSQGSSALHWVCGNNDPATVRALIEAGADPAEEIANGRNALDVAMRFGCDEEAQAMIEAGAEPLQGWESWAAALSEMPLARAARARAEAGEIDQSLGAAAASSGKGPARI